jgi:uroporphyrin-III C-methyltransferase
MRVISQICEYWPLKRLAALTDDDVADILASCSSAAESLTTMPPIPQQRSGSITLAGSGPGHPALLTVATLRAIRSADVILADKLVPAAILDLVPRRARVAIARKFPGRSADAQDELQTSALAAAQAGANVLRLKQGDPFMFARGADEALWFRERGFPPRILPGLTSALVAPLAARVAVTSRGVADHVVVASGTATGGAAPRLPGCLGGRTAVLLMALHRLRDVVAALTEDVGDDAKGREGAAWPTDTPCVVVERASCRDQRVVRTSLRDVCAAVDELGSRPPGLLIVGAACETLTKRDGPWTVEEGCDEFEHFADWAIGDAALWTQGE